MAESASAETLPLGTSIVFEQAEVVWFNGESSIIRDAAKLGAALVAAYENRQPDDPPHGGRIRLGYERLALTVTVGDHETVWISELARPFVSWNWTQFGYPQVTKNLGNSSWSCCPAKPTLILPGHDGKELGEFFNQLGQDNTLGLVEQHYASMGTLSHTDYVLLCLHPDSNVLARGVIDFWRDHSLGDTQMRLWKLEGYGEWWYEEYGRGDHVGSHPSVTFGL